MKAAVFALLAFFTSAPFQCASDPDPNRRLEDGAPDALWELSERFDEKGNEEARRETLEHLIERYPRSRFATRAARALEEMNAANNAPPLADEL